MKEFAISEVPHGKITSIAQNAVLLQSAKFHAIPTSSPK